MIWVIKGWRNLPARCLFLEESTSSPNSHPQPGCFVATSRFLLSQIITNMSDVSPYDVRWRRRAAWLKRHGDASHPLSLSISSQCSRLMELLIGGKPLVSWTPGFPADGTHGGVDPVLISCRTKTSYSAAPASHCSTAPCFLLGFLHTFALCT